MMNSVNLNGRLVADVEVRALNSERNVANMRIAVDKRLSKQKREEFEAAGKPTADFFNVVAFGMTADFMAKHAKKGTLIGVSGRLQSGSYDAQDGTKRYTTEVVADNIDILQWDNAEKGNTAEPEVGVEGFQPVDSEDIPF